MTAWMRFNRRMAAVMPLLGTVRCGPLQARVLRLHDVSADPGQGAPEHTHAWLELSVVHQGEVAYLAQGETRQVAPGGLFAMPPGIRHCWRPLMPRTMISGYQLQVSPVDGAHRAALEAWYAALADGGWTRAAHPFARALVTELHAAVEDGLSLDGLAVLLRAHLGWTLERLGAPGPEPAAGAVPARDERVGRIKEWILEHLDEDCRLGDLARRCRITPRHLSRIFLAETGTSVRHFIIEQRLWRAYDTLSWNDQTVSTVARSLGFRDVPHFVRQFKARYGASPARWRSDRQAGR